MTDSPYWPFWAGALALTAIPLLHWLTLGRMFAVSGRFTALTDAVRARLLRREPDEGDGGMTEAEMIAAMREATAAAFGPGAVAEPEPEAASPCDSMPRVGATASKAAQPLSHHFLFLGALVVGGAISALTAGTFSLGGLDKMGPTFGSIFGEGLGAAVALVGGGLLVGFGTRMAGGCTSGHGLCGVSRFQPGSLLATAAFFGTGIAVSFLLGALS